MLTKSVSMAEQLRSRWSVNKINQINYQLAAHKLDYKKLEKVEIAGKWVYDLRGFTIIEAIRDGELSELDFSYCTTEGAGGFIATTFRSCRFVEAELNGNIGNNATECDFTGARFNGLYGQYVDCCFARASMPTTGSNLTFVRCDFSNSNWRKLNILRSVFDHCIWNGCKFRSGSLSFSRFTGTRPDPIALGNTMMDDVIFE